MLWLTAKQEEEDIPSIVPISFECCLGCISALLATNPLQSPAYSSENDQWRCSHRNATQAELTDLNRNVFGFEIGVNDATFPV